VSLGEQVCEIHSLTGEIFLNDKTIVLRPKTFQLFLLLASKPESVFSKAEILASVWQGSVVEDQVIFQSINEIRKQFSNPDVIITYPRRGYSIGIAASIVERLEVNKTTDNKSLSLMSFTKHYKTLLIASLIFMAIVVSYFVATNGLISPQTMSKANDSAEQRTLDHKGILVLPLNVRALPESQQWLRYGAMEGIIKKILPNKAVTIFHLEDVIEILNRIPVGHRNNINNIFSLSGTSYVLETSVSGTPGELNFVYTIYSRTGKNTQTINVINYESALSEIVNSLEKALDENLVYDAGEFDKQLQNDLISKAVQFLEVDDYASALTFINGAVINDPNNMTALYFLIKTKLSLNEIQDALTASSKALALIANGSDDQYKSRLLYFKGMALLSMGQLATAEQNMLAANTLARQKKDWLYYAYSQSMMGKIRQIQQRYDNAYDLFSSALEYQELLNCPLGIIQGHVDFAEYYLSRGERSLAEQSFGKANALMNEKKLIKARPLLKELQDRMASL